MKKGAQPVNRSLIKAFLAFRGFVLEARETMRPLRKIRNLPLHHFNVKPFQILITGKALIFGVSEAIFESY